MSLNVNKSQPEIAAEARPTLRELHGQTWVDEYAWMRDAAADELLPYLRAERTFYDQTADHATHLRATLFAELKQRRLPTDESVRIRRGDKFYYTRTVIGSEYEQFLSSRDRESSGTVLLDEADFATADGYVAIGVRMTDPDGRFLAYSVDTAGDEVYALRFRNLATLTDLAEVIPRTYYGGAFSHGASHFFYVVHDDLYRPHQVWRHELGQPADRDVLVYSEPDERFSLFVRATGDDRYVVIEAHSTDTGETWLVPAEDPTAPPMSVGGRRAGVHYWVEHLRDPDQLMTVTNDGAEEFRLAVGDGWESPRYAPYRIDERLIAVHPTRTHLVLRLRRGGFPLLRLIDRATGTATEVTAELAAATLSLPEPPRYDDESITIEVQSLTHPPSWWEINLATGHRELRKQQVVPGYDESRYRTERVLAPAPDGVLVPVDIAYATGTALDGTAPALLWGYGAYESCDDPWFDPAVISLLDRGFVYALTHPRGGGENGRGWWRAGRLAAKANTFSDHIAAADFLAGSMVDGDRIATRGLSAGGLLQARVATLRPDRWAAVVAEVPFVDVVGSMSDPTIPLTIGEYAEWGNPAQAEDFGWLSAYSPYENLPRSPRPPMLVTAAWHDPRVLVHEPTKYVARLRATAKPDDGELLYRVELGAGAHTGPAGRYAHLAYEAEILAFVLRHLP